MSGKKVLYVSGSLGLGHIIRDLAIANELRARHSSLDIFWLASHPASQIITEAGENLHPDAGQYANDNIPAESAAKDTQLNLLKYLMNASKEWTRNFDVLTQVLDKEHFDLLIGDETYEITVGYQKKPHLKKVPFVMIYDFVGLDAMTKSPMEKLGIYIWNRIWSKDFKAGRKPIFDLGLFVGEKEDVPDRPFGLGLPNRQEYAQSVLNFIGYVFPFAASDYMDKAKIRAQLGYGEEPLVICAIGGTSVGKVLLDLCGKSYALVKKQLPTLRMILVCGPRLAGETLDVPQGVEVAGYVPHLYKHFAACDLAIVQGGATSTLELTALKRPFLYFPLEGHFEQAYVAERLVRHQAGVKMSYSQTTPNMLAETVLATMDKALTYATIPTDGAKTAAKLISPLLKQ